ncbi:MAG: hypothetical protein V2A77_10075 [Pseudomonadota bacterium]
MQKTPWRGRFQRLARLEAVLFCLLLVKLSLTALWLAASPASAGEAVAARSAKPTSGQGAGAEQSLLERQREELRRREERLQLRESEMEALAADVERRLSELNELQTRLNDMQARLKAGMATLETEKDKAAVKRIKQLVQVYSSMKAEKAAALIDKLDDDVVTKIFSQMPSSNAGKILSFVEAEKAARISQRLAGR